MPPKQSFTARGKKCAHAEINSSPQMPFEAIDYLYLCDRKIRCYLSSHYETPASISMMKEYREQSSTDRSCHFYLALLVALQRFQDQMDVIMPSIEELVASNPMCASFEALIALFCLLAAMINCTNFTGIDEWSCLSPSVNVFKYSLWLWAKS